VATWLNESLSRVARVRNLLALASAGAGTRTLDATAPNVGIELIRYPDDLPTSKPQIFRWGAAGIKVQEGDCAALAASVHRGTCAGLARFGPPRRGEFASKRFLLRSLDLRAQDDVASALRSDTPKHRARDCARRSM
jgi:hypothetical protein